MKPLAATLQQLEKQQMIMASILWVSQRPTLTLLDSQCKKRSDKLLSTILIQRILNWSRPVVIDNIILTENLGELCC